MKPKHAGAVRTPECPIQRDVLEDALRHARVTTTVYGRSVVRAPWGFSVPRGDLASFTIVRSGSAWLELEGIAHRWQLRACDVVILPHGAAHAYRDHPATPAPLIHEIMKRHPIRSEDGSMYQACRGSEPRNVS